MSDQANTISITPPAVCEWCKVIHLAKCPQVKAYEYWPDGKLKRIEFHENKPAVGPGRATLGPLT
jgi:hypothetical protein